MMMMRRVLEEKRREEDLRLHPESFYAGVSNF